MRPGGGLIIYGKSPYCHRQVTYNRPGPLWVVLSPRRSHVLLQKIRVWITTKRSVYRTSSEAYGPSANSSCLLQPGYIFDIETQSSFMSGGP